MGWMRMSDEYLAETLQVCKWTIENTEPLHSQHIRSKKLIRRIMKFIKQTGRDKNVNERIKESNNRAVLFND